MFLNPFRFRLLFFFFACALRADSFDGPAAADTALFENNPDNNLGGMTFMPIGVNGLGNRARGLIRFDVSAIPTNAIVTNAVLTLPVSAGNAFNADNYSIHRMLQGWIPGNKIGGGSTAGWLGAPADPGEPTWHYRSFTNILWSAPGGQADVDYVSANSAGGPVSGPGTYVFNTPELAADVQLWVNRTATNSGWMMKIDDEATAGTARRFNSIESGTPPFLSIGYTVPPPATNEPPVIDGISANGARVEIRYTVQPTYSIDLEFSTAVASTNWTTLTNTVANTGPVPVTYSDATSPDPARFYRLRVAGRVR